MFGNTYSVGPAGLSAVLIASDDGHVLIDGALPQSAPGIAENLRTLGFRLDERGGGTGTGWTGAEGAPGRARSGPRV